jgi:hypothetical protein
LTQLVQNKVISNTNVTPGYSAVARHGENKAKGWVSYALLTRRKAIVNFLEFFQPPDWLAEIFGKRRWIDEDGTPLRSYSAYIPTPPEFAEWLRADYTRRFQEALDQLRAGIEPEDYRHPWYYEFCQEAGLNCMDRPTSEQLLAALKG